MLYFDEQSSIFGTVARDQLSRTPISTHLRGKGWGRVRLGGNSAWVRADSNCTGAVCGAAKCKLRVYVKAAFYIIVWFWFLFVWFFYFLK